MKTRTSFYALLVIVVFVVLTIVAKVFIYVHNQHRAFEMKDCMFYAFMNSSARYKHQHGMMPMNIADITNGIGWARFFEKFDAQELSKKALPRAYYIRNSNKFEFGYIEKELTDGILIETVSEKCGKWTWDETFLPVICRSAHQLALTGFSGVAATGTLQMFADDLSSSYAK